MMKFLMFDEKIFREFKDSKEASIQAFITAYISASLVLPLLIFRIFLQSFLTDSEPLKNLLYSLELLRILIFDPLFSTNLTIVLILLTIFFIAIPLSFVGGIIVLAHVMTYIGKSFKVDLTSAQSFRLLGFGSIILALTSISAFLIGVLMDIARLNERGFDLGVFMTENAIPTLVLVLIFGLYFIILLTYGLAKITGAGHLKSLGVLIISLFIGIIPMEFVSLYVFTSFVTLILLIIIIGGLL